MAWPFHEAGTTKCKGDNRRLWGFGRELGTRVAGATRGLGLVFITSPLTRIKNTVTNVQDRWGQKLQSKLPWIFFLLHSLNAPANITKN